VLAVIVEEQRLGGALALVIAGARANRIDIAAIIFGLRVHGRIAIDLGSRGLEDLCLHPLGKAEHVDRPEDAGLGRLHGIELVVDRRGRTGEVVDLVDFDIEREADIVSHRLEVRIAEKMRDVILAPGKVVVDAEHVVPLFE